MLSALLSLQLLANAVGCVALTDGHQEEQRQTRLCEEWKNVWTQPDTDNITYKSVAVRWNDVVSTTLEAYCPDISTFLSGSPVLSDELQTA